MTPATADARGLARSRDAALARVRRITTFIAVGGVASVGVLTAAVAGTIPGRAKPASSGTSPGTSQGGSSAGLQPPAVVPQPGYGYGSGGYGSGGYGSGGAVTVPQAPVTTSGAS